MKQYIFCFYILIHLSSTSFSQIHRSSEITVNELREHVKYLASDKLEGRKTGTEGAELAYKYIANEFQTYGLKPYGDSNSFFQKFDFIASVKLGSKNYCNISAIDNDNTKNKVNTLHNKQLDLIVNKDYRPLGFSANGKFDGEVVFAGYGISVPDKNYDDYKGLDVKNKAIIVLRYAPPGDSSKGNFEQYSSLRYKSSKAKELGAKALIIVTGPSDSNNDDLPRLAYDQAMGNAGIIVINVTRQLADSILTYHQTSIKKLQDEILQSKSPNSFFLKETKISLNVNIEEIHAAGVNVIGYLEGNDTVLQNEVIILGAHYDHLGYGGEGSGSLRPDTIAIHPGADDNASGISGLLELAQLFSSQRDKLKRGMLFIAFAGEEMGLLGSSNYVKHPALSLDSSIAMLNLDMIGQLRNRTLIIYGIGTSASFDSLTREHNLDSTFVLKLNKDGFGPSDHSSFYSKQIPVLHFFTDLNEFYHRPYDTYEKINYEGLYKVVSYVASIAKDMNKMPQRPKFIATEMPKSSGNVGRSMRVFVGTIPDFSEQTDGMKISGVREGSPAAKAGLKSGDVIIKFGKVDIKNLYDYTYALGEYKAGEIVDVSIKRGEKIITTKVSLERRN